MVNTAVEEFISGLRAELDLLEREERLLKRKKQNSLNVSDEDEMELRRNIGSPQF